MRILIVDDFAPLRRLAAVLLADSGITIVGDASDGEAAVDAARRLTPDVVLLDYQMPRMDGLTAARLLKQLPHAPRIVLWSSDAEELVGAARAAGIDAVLPKGCSQSQLQQALMPAAA